MEDLRPRASLADIEDFETQRCGYFAKDYTTTSIFWSSLCDAMGDNDGSTDQVLGYIAGKLETDRVFAASVYANADRVFGDKKGASKLRHDNIRHAEQKAKLKGEDPPVLEDALVPGGAGREQPANTTVKAIWEMAEMDCRAARHRDELCDELEGETLLGKVKAMGKETHRLFRELTDEGESCLLSLRNIDKQVGEAFLRLKENLGTQLGGKALNDDVWFLDCRYRTAVVHQKEAWEAVSNKLKEVFAKMKQLEFERRETLREFLINANDAVKTSWGKLPALCAPATECAESVDASKTAVDRDVGARAAEEAAEKSRTVNSSHELFNTTRMTHADPIPESSSFIDSLTAPLESPLVRQIMMVERREGNAIRSTYHPGLMVLTWQGFVHFFDVPESSGLKKDVSPAAAFQDISPTISLDDLVANRRDLEEVLLFKSTHTLQLAEDSVVEAGSSKKSHKIEVKAKTHVKRTFGSGVSNKTVIFRTTTEAEMNATVDNIKGSIQDMGCVWEDGMPPARQSIGAGRTSFGSVKSDLSANQAPPAPEPTPAPATTVPAPEPAPAVEKPPPSPPAVKTEPAAPVVAPAGEGSSEEVPAVPA